MRDHSMRLALRLEAEERHQPVSLDPFGVEIDVVVSSVLRRFVDALSYDAIACRFALEGLQVSAAMVRSWHHTCECMLAPLLAAMWSDIGGLYLCAWARARASGSVAWLLVVPDRHVLYSCDGAGVARALASYRGFVIDDPRVAHEHLHRLWADRRGDWIDLRRQLLQVLASEPDRAREGLAMLARLFRVEARSAALDPGSRLAWRRAHAGPIVREFSAWCARQRSATRGQSALGDALVAEAHNQQRLHEFLSDPLVGLDDGEAWSRPGLELLEFSATFCSLLSSCEINRIAPGAYLSSLLQAWPRWSSRRALELAPAYWRPPASFVDGN